MVKGALIASSIEEEVNTVSKDLQRHTTSSLALMYADQLSHFYQKLEGFQGKTPRHKLLHFDVKQWQASKSTVDNVSPPALKETVDFTIDTWLYCFELSGTCSIFANKFSGPGPGTVFLGSYRSKSPIIAQWKLSS